MTDHHLTWQENNNHYLTVALMWLRTRLTNHITLSEEGDSTKPAASETTLTELENAMLQAEAVTPPPALVMMSRRLGLSRFEQYVLLLCAALDLDTRVAGLCAAAQGNPKQHYPTFALALSLFDNPTWSILSPQSPLRYWRLIEVKQTDTLGLTASPLRVDERILNYLKGLNHLDETLTPFVMPLNVVDNEETLSASQQERASTILQRLSQQNRINGAHIIQLLGSDITSKQLTAHYTAEQLGLKLYHLPAQLLPTNPHNLETFMRLWQRETLLMPVGLYLDAYDLDESPQVSGPASPLARFLQRCQSLIFLDTREVRAGLERTSLTFEIVKPVPIEQYAVWESTLKETLNGSTIEVAGLLAGQFDLNLPAIQKIARDVLTQEIERDHLLRPALWESCLCHTRPQLEKLIQRLDLKATWQDIVLPAREIEMLHQIVHQINQRTKVYETWGFRHKKNRGLGTIVLFAGESGTGKTMAAEVIANELNLDLYRIDLSAIVSKYIGETEKNLCRLFDAAEEGGAILFFDEADSLFGKRGAVKDSHDRYANIEINYLLQRIEAYKGLAILATNRKADLDEAFIRRLRFIISFPKPDAVSRQHIWQKVFPAETPLTPLNYETLASYNLTGGSIFNAALNAAFLAAHEDKPVSMPFVLDAIDSEFTKTGRFLRH